MGQNRGLIANPDLEGQKVRGVYFFAGNWRFALPGQPPFQFYEYAVGPNNDLYTVIRADEFSAMLIIAEERDVLEHEKLPGAGGHLPR